MPQNKNAAYRYRLIDLALSNRYRKWRFEELQEFVSHHLREDHGIDSISERALVDDIRIMRADPPMGFAAPIKRAGGYVFYTDPDFRIQQQPPLTEEDLVRLQQALQVLQEFPGLPHYEQLLPLLCKLSGAAQADQLRHLAAGRAIAFDHNAGLFGLQWLGPIYTAILQQRALRLKYQAFGDPEPEEFSIHPYFLKQFNQRWFLLTHHHEQDDFTILGLERILAVLPTGLPYRPNTEIDFDGYFEHVVGITRSPDDVPQRILLEFSAQRAPYIITKPIHHSQRVVERLSDGGALIELFIIPNFEFRAILLSHAGAVRVLAPVSLREELAALHREGLMAMGQGGIPPMDGMG
jgi:predicted DNA-binding transcriptional regulator YafY